MRVASLAVVVVPAFVVVAACGSSDTTAPTSPAAAGTGGNAAGGAGRAATGGGAGGSSAGAGGAPASGGTSSTAGAGGTSGGRGGTGGASVLPCTVGADCPTITSVPMGCATPHCDPATKTCAYDAVDADGDGHASATCTSTQAKVTVGDDCNDANAAVHPGAWDGPASGANPDSCDSVDEDCDGVPDDGQANGVSCTCHAGDTQACATDASGKPVTFPGGKAQGECHPGSAQCGADGALGPCVGAQGPVEESCNGKDDDCDGVIDNPPQSDAVAWVYDGDGDGFAGKYAPVTSCENIPPTAPPAECPTCDPDGWKLAKGEQGGDCDDGNPSAHPGATESCGDTKDLDCDGNDDPPGGCGCTMDVPCTYKSCPGVQTCQTTSGVGVLGTCEPDAAHAGSKCDCTMDTSCTVEPFGCPGTAACDTTNSSGTCMPTGTCECKDPAPCNDQNGCAGERACTNHQLGMSCTKTGTCVPGVHQSCTIDTYAGSRVCAPTTCVYPTTCTLAGDVKFGSVSNVNGDYPCSTGTSFPMLPGKYSIDVTCPFDQQHSLTVKDSAGNVYTGTPCGGLGQQMATVPITIAGVETAVTFTMGAGQTGVCNFSIQASCTSGGCKAGSVY